MCGTLHSVSTLLTIVGLPHRPLTCGNGGLARGLRALAFERVEQRGLFAADVAPGAGVQMQLEAVARAEDVLAEIAARRTPRRWPRQAARAASVYSPRRKM